MSFNNDEDGDGLAALFGGITPQATPKPAEAARPVVAPTPVAQQPDAPGYPAATSYDLPAPTAQPPAGAAYPGGTPQYPGLSPAPTAAPQNPSTGFPGAQYSPTPTAAPQYGAPQAPAPQYAAPQSPAPQYEAPQTQAPQYGAPQAPAPQYEAPQAPAQYEAPQSPSPQYPPAQYPGLAPQGAPSYDLPAPVSPPPVSHPAQPAPTGAPTPLAEPPGYSGFDQPPTGYGGYSPAAPDDVAQPVSYDLPAPAAAPSPSATPTYDPAPGYDPAPAHDPAAAYGATPGYQQTAVYPSQQQVPSGYEAPPAAPPAPEQFGGVDPQRSYAPAEPAAPPAAAELIPAPVTPAGPLLPSRTAAVVTPEDLERSTVGEKIGLVLAILAGPIGLLVAIVTAARGGRRRGWLIGISRVSLVLGVLSTIATVIAAVIFWNIRVDQMQHDALAAASAEFCAAAEADPAMVTPPTVGFPTQGNSIPETIEAMTAWTTRWTELAATSPAELRTGLELLAEKGQTIVDSVTDSRSVDDALNAQVIGSAEAQAGVVAWYTNYCVAP